MKYIIEIAKEYEEYFKGILICGIAEGKFAVDVIAKEDLEELNSDYINEHFSDLQDTAYKKGFEDGKAVFDKGCEGCQYEGKVVTGPPCISCCNSYKNQWTAKQTYDEIKVGDEVYAYTSSGKTQPFVIIKIYDEDGVKYYSGINANGNHVQGGLNYIKTGRHFPHVAELLKEMQS